MDYSPKRIICLTEETTETLYMLGEEDRIVGISGFTVRPAKARKEKPKVSAFTSAKIDKILELNPDLVLGFSDLQADIAAELIRAGITVHIFNHRTVAGIFQMIRQVGDMVGAAEKTSALITQLQKIISTIQNTANTLPKKPLIYFEEWNDPLISGIGWVSELIELAGGRDCFPELGKQHAARDRIIADPQEVVRRNPDIIIGSWCGKRVRTELIAKREGWQHINAVKHQHIYEVKSCDILQPGPAALTDGLSQLQNIILEWSSHTH